MCDFFQFVKKMLYLHLIDLKMFNFFVPIANVVIAIWMTNLLSKSFGKDEVFTVGLILLPFVFYPILGLGDAKYNGPAGAATTEEVV